MTSREAYNRFLLKINKVDTNTEIAILILLFVLLYNSESLKWLSEKITKKESTDDINDINELLVNDYSISVSDIHETHDDFNLPDDFFYYVNSYSKATNGNCNKNLLHYMIKPKNRNVYYEDESSKLSLEWEETFVELSNNKILVFKDNFSVIELLLDYYKKPLKIDISGYYDSDNNLSKDINLDINDMSVNEIIDRCAVEIIRQYENLEGFELSTDRLNRES